jgi:DNA-binding MarR family transcriptional regulator
MAHAMDRITNARSLSRDIGVSYAAAHAAVERLVGRGLLLRHRNGVRQELSPSAFAVNALKVES